MIRLASILMLVVFATTLVVVLRTNGLTATLLMFAGAPSLVLGLGLWGVALRRSVTHSDGKSL